jgi:lipopolysaccharide/colanic/teichoic acid biosynthesis glycosyltransferase
MSARVPAHGARAGYPLERSLDLAVALVALLLTLPLLLIALAAVWLQDRGNPFYVAERVGLGGRPFRFVKIRTMVDGASANAVDTTVAGDPRITAVGRAIRVIKLDELPQFLHVLTGHMSMVGPRPNVPREVALYTSEERALLTVRPGITDIASIVFADLADTLSEAGDPNIAYNQLVRPWKSRLGLHYVRCASLGNDLRIISYTVSVLFARRWTLRRISILMRRTGAPDELCRFVLREEPLRPVPPPGANAIVTSRSVEQIAQGSMEG